MPTQTEQPARQILAAFLTEPHGRRPPEEPSETATRVVWLLFTLLVYDKVDATSYVRMFSVSERTFRRDIRRLSEIGRVCGFRLGPLRGGEVKLMSREIRLQPLLRGSQKLLDLVRAMACAFGGPVLETLGPSLEPAPSGDSPFLRFCAPKLVEDSAAGKTFLALQSAYESKARVQFRYIARDDSTSSREVEPYGVIWNAGRFYLIAYDCSPRRAWRQFALDRIQGPIRRTGTFTLRPVPERYLADDAVGLFKGERTTEVTIELSPAIAAAVTCRLWQAAQRVKRMNNGCCQITFSVGDINEAVRWAMGFGADARVVDPPEAVRVAAKTARALAAAYTIRLVGPAAAKTA